VTEPVLEVKDFSVVYRTPSGDVRAVSDVNLDLYAGEVVGLVGESGSGKSTLAYGANRLLRAPAVITGGSVVYRGRRAAGPMDIMQLGKAELRRLRWREIAIVFQSAMNALNPVLNVRDQILDVIHAHLRVSREEAREKAGSLLDLVGIPRSRLRSYPHELSGGMRQRAMIAAALACEPRLLIADEPTTALDVTIQREILELIDDLRVQLGMAVILVTHDLGVIGGRTDKVAVMYGGRIIEQAATRAVFGGPRHPYTEALFEALPELAGPVTFAVNCTALPSADRTAGPGTDSPGT